MQRLPLLGCLILILLPYALFQTIRYTGTNYRILRLNADKNARPQSSVTDIHMSLHIKDLYDFSEQDMTFKMKYYFRLYWLEPAATFDLSETSVKIGENDNWVKFNYSNSNIRPLNQRVATTLDIDTRALAGEFWFPDIYIVNRIPADFDQLKYENGFAKLYPDGRIFFSKIVTSSIRCHMNLSKLPFDSQYCSVIFESFSYGPEGLVIQWKRDSQRGAVLSDNITLDDFDLMGKIILVHRFTRQSEIASYIGGKT